MNVSEVKTNLYIQLAHDQICRQDAEFSAGKDYTSSILTLARDAEESFAEYMASGAIVSPKYLYSMKLAIVSVKARGYDFKNRIDNSKKTAIESIEVFDEGLKFHLNGEIYNQNVAVKLYNYILVSKAYAQQILHSFDDAISNYLAAVTFFTREEYAVDWADAKFNIGLCLYQSDFTRIEEACECFKFAISVFYDKYIQGNVLYEKNLAISYFHLSQCSNILFKRKRHADYSQQANYYGSLANLHLAAIDPVKAKEYQRILQKNRSDRAN